MTESNRNCLPLNPARISMLFLFAVATITLIPLHWHFAGTVAWIACLLLIWQDPEKKLRRRMSVLMGCIAVLGIADINSSTETANFLRVGIPFTIVILVPFLILRKTDQGVITYRFWPKVWRKHDIIYTILSIPLAWLVLKFYWWATPEQYMQWTLPETPDDSHIKRLFIGINMVGVWDELFFVNTVYAVLRSLFSYRVANAVQAIVYTAVLYDMAFIGVGPIIILFFAWTQGSMFEKSESLLWVLIVHLIVDFFLVAAIVHSYYPSYGLDFLWRHGF